MKPPASRTAKRIPPTTDEKCAKYGATISKCGCPDNVHGASYLYKSVILCKHRYHQIRKAELAFEANETTTANEITKRPFCLCSEFIARGFMGCKHLTLMTQMRQMFQAAFHCDLSAAAQKVDKSRLIWTVDKTGARYEPKPPKAPEPTDDELFAMLRV